MDRFLRYDFRRVDAPNIATSEHLPMATVHFDLNEDLLTLLRQQHSSIEVAARELMVMELYRRGAVSRGKAAELLGMPLADFLQRASELGRSEEHTSELQSLAYLVCRLLLEKKKSIQN